MTVSRIGKFGIGVLGALTVLAGVALAVLWLAHGFGASPGDRGRAAYERGDYRQTRIYSLEVLTRKPDDLAALRLLARASARLGNDETAMSVFARLGDSGMEAEDFAALGARLERQAQLTEALSVYERGRKLGPDHPEILHALARLYAREGRLTEAIEASGQLAQCPGWEARGNLIRGVLEVEYAEPAGAAAALDRALQADPSLSGGMTTPDQARKLLAGAWLRTGDADRALDALRPVLGTGADSEASWLSSRALLRLGKIDPALEALARAGEFTKDDPTRPDPAPYVGAKACQQCHPSEFQSQRMSRHARTFSAGADLNELQLPDVPVADTVLPATSHSLRREGDAIRLTTRTGDKELTAWIAFAVGSGDRGLTMVTKPQQGLSRVCRISTYLGNTLWELTSHAANPHPGDAGGPLGRPMTREATEKCTDCHVTSINAARDRTVPEALDRGIGCERCHGPGGNHLVAVDRKFPDLAIARPALASADQILKLCGACHKADDPSLTEADPRFVRFQAAGLPLSRCLTESLGALSCVTCHDPHRDADTNPASYEARCLDCHGPASSGSVPAGRHSLAVSKAMRHVACPVNPASGCVACHMPKLEGAAPHATFADHRIRKRPTGAVANALHDAAGRRSTP